MVKKERDSKFVIYQVLYIFVITVLALKGADLDLSRVVAEEQSVDKAVRDSLVVLLDSLYEQNVKFSINIDPNVKVENEELKQKLASMNQRIQTLAEKVKEIPPEEEKPEITEEQNLMQLPISVTQTFIQNTWNKAKNTGSVPTYILDPKNASKPLAVIQAGEEKDIRIAVFGPGFMQEPIEILCALDEAMLKMPKKKKKPLRTSPKPSEIGDNFNGRQKI